MIKGFSEPWPVVLQELGGSENMDPQPIIDYFQPLIAFLDQALLDAGQCIGWGGEFDIIFIILFIVRLSHDHF